MVLIMAKDYCIRRHVGMCSCIDYGFLKIGINISYANIRKLIPEFNLEFLTGKFVEKDTCFYWWPSYDIESRIDAFDRLIKIYSK